MSAYAAKRRDVRSKWLDHEDSTSLLLNQSALVEVQQVIHRAFVETALLDKLKDVKLIFDLVLSVFDNPREFISPARKDQGEERLNEEHNSVNDRAGDPHLGLDVSLGFLDQL